MILEARLGARRGVRRLPAGALRRRPPTPHLGPPHHHRHPTLRRPGPPGHGQGTAVDGFGYGAPVPPRRSSTSGLAIAALVVGFVSVFVPYVGGLVAIALGIVALIGIARSNGTRTGSAMAGIGIVLGVVTIVGWTLLVTSDGFQESVREGLEDGARDLATSTILTVGQCLDVSTADSNNWSVSADSVVPCTGPHTAEYAGPTSLPYPDGADYPGDIQVFEEGVEACLDIFLAYTGTELATRERLDVLVQHPRSLTWRLSNDREISCFVIDIDGGTLTGSVRG